MKFTASSTRLINASLEDVYTNMIDFEEKNLWNPWYYGRNDLNLSETGEKGKVGYTSKWDVPNSSTGWETIEELSENEYMKTSLTFVKPFKGGGYSSIYIAEKGEQVEVRWEYEGTLPFFLFFWKGMMEQSIATSQRMGLDLLSMRLDPNDKGFEMANQGIVTLPAKSYFVSDGSGYKADVGKSFMSCLSNVDKALDDAEVKEKGNIFGLYYKVDIKKWFFNFGAGYQLDSSTEIAAEDLVRRDIPQNDYIKIDFRGDFDKIDYAYQTAYSYAMENKRRVLQNPKIPSMEEYVNVSFESEDQSQNQTVVYLPLK